MKYIDLFFNIIELLAIVIGISALCIIPAFHGIYFLMIFGAVPVAMLIVIIYMEISLTISDWE